MCTVANSSRDTDFNSDAEPRRSQSARPWSRGKRPTIAGRRILPPPPERTTRTLYSRIPLLHFRLTTLTVDTPRVAMTEEGTIVGTFQYMSPEQVEGKEFDGRSDIFLQFAINRIEDAT